jgi:hypothetical protein
LSVEDTDNYAIQIFLGKSNSKDTNEEAIHSKKFKSEKFTEKQTG